MFFHEYIIEQFYIRFGRHFGTLHIIVLDWCSSKNGLMILWMDREMFIYVFGGIGVSIFGYYTKNLSTLHIRRGVGVSVIPSFQHFSLIFFVIYPLFIIE